MSMYEHLPLHEPVDDPDGGVQLIPGTTLPRHTGPGGQQGEGRGEVVLSADRLAPGMVQPEEPDGLEPAQRAAIAAALRAYDRGPMRERHVQDQASGTADATTGNAVIPLFTVPAGWEGHIVQVLVDAPQSATINPSAPYANAASWAFLSISQGLGGSSAAGIGNSSTDALRRGMVTFAPTSAAGPILPGIWTYNDSNAPIAFGGETIFFVLHGGSIAALQGLSLRASYRVNLFSRD